MFSISHLSKVTYFLILWDFDGNPSADKYLFVISKDMLLLTSACLNSMAYFAVTYVRPNITSYKQQQRT